MIENKEIATGILHTGPDQRFANWRSLDGAKGRPTLCNEFEPLNIHLQSHLTKTIEKFISINKKRNHYANLDYYNEFALETFKSLKKVIQICSFRECLVKTILKEGMSKNGSKNCLFCK